MPLVSVSAPVVIKASANESVPPAPDFVTALASVNPFEVMVCVPEVPEKARPPVNEFVSPMGSVRLLEERLREALPAKVMVAESVSVPAILTVPELCVHVPVNPVKSKLLNT